MTSTKISPLRMEAPRLTADVALGEHLAALARASAPSAASRVRRSGWGVPLAAFATIAASSSVAYAGQSALDHELKADKPAVALRATTPTATSAAAFDIARAAAAIVAQPVAPKSTHTNPHGKVVGQGHPKTGKTKGHPDTHDAGKHHGHPPSK